MQIYVAEGTQHTGPFDLETIKAGLRTGRYQPDQLAWYQGAPGWEPISKLPGIAGFLPPPPPAAPAPPAAPTIPAQYQTPYQPPYQAAPSAPAYYPPAAPRRWPWWLVATAIIVGLGALASGIVTMSRGLRSDRADNPSPALTASEATPTPAPTTAPAQVPVAPAAPSLPTTRTRHYAVSRAKYSGDLATHFVAFSFDYPEDWKILENVSDEYVEVHRYVRLPNGNNVAAESISFSYAHSRPGVALASSLSTTGAQLLEMAASGLVGRFPEAEKTSSRAGRYGRYPAQEQFFVSPADEDEGRPGMFFRQAIVARPNNNSTDGLFITMFGSEPGGNTDAESLGKSGGSQTIEDSFRFEQ